jgi:uncharacterized membrane protein YuzA (DUF378 family)
MRQKVLALVTLLLVILSAIPFSSVHAAGLSINTGIVGTQVSITGLTDGSSFRILWDGAVIDSGTLSGVTYRNFNVPEAYGGSHTLVVESPVGTPVALPYSTFTVLPSISIDPLNGVVGQTITVTGHGFAASEANIAITVDSNVVQSGITASSVGYWSTTFSAPAGARGNRSIDAYGATTTATNVSNKDFYLYPSVKMDPSSGGVGTVVTITATGFAASESLIKVLYSTKEVRTGVTADSNGSWNTTFTIPSSTKGPHTINVSGSSTPQKDIADLIFTVAPSVNISPNTGLIDDTVKISGSGFYNNESSINVTFDGNIIQSSISADDSGAWNTNIKIPSASNGPHTIGANGRLTSASDVTTATFTIQTSLSLLPKNGNVGDEIKATGTGFSNSKDFTITFNNTAVANGATLDTGTFSTTFKALGGKGGAINVVATDSKGVTATAVFNMETTPPDMPATSSPKDGATVGFMGETKVVFKWGAVSDPSGISYDIEVSDDSGFGRKLISRTKLTSTSYTTSEAEALNNGEYYWHVRAVDGAGNKSDWSTTSTVKVGFITMGTIIWLVVGVLALLILIIVIRQMSRMKKKDREKSEWD